MIKKIVLSLLLVSLVGFYSGCITKTTNNSNPIGEKTETQTVSSPTPKLTNNQINNATNAANQQLSNTKTMKTIKDFKKIKASEVVIKTTKGNITAKLYREKAPLTTANFLDLVDSKFYDGVVFHRVIPDFMAQVGDPLSKDETKKSLWGTGGPGYSIADEFNDDLKHDSPGILSMANSGPNTGGSQIFITHVATPWLDGKHSVFGKVTKGLEVLMKIKQGDKIISINYK